MANADLTRLLNNARIHLPGATDTNIQLELFNVLNEFFQTSNIWQEKIGFTLVAGQTDYTIVQESPAAIVRLFGIVNADELPVFGTMTEPGEIVLNTAPGYAGVCTATVSLTVVDPLTREGNPQFPAWMLPKYGMGLLEGLLGRMMAQPAKPYTNERMAIFHIRKFTSVMSQASVDALHKNIHGAQAWRFPQSFATRRR